MLITTQSKSKTQITRSVHCKFNCITVKYNGTQHNSLLTGIETLYDAKQVKLNRIFNLTWLCVVSNYPLKIIRSSNLAYTFCDVFRHLYMSPD